MNSAALQARLQPLHESLKQTKQLINRLSKLPTSPGSSLIGEQQGDADARVELSEEIHQTLKEQEDEFELIQQEAEDLTNSSSWAQRRDSGRHASGGREREKAELASSVTRLGEDLKTARVQFRKAQLQAKRNAEAAQRRERELFLLEIQNEASPTTSSNGVESSKLSNPNDINSLSSPTSIAAGGRKPRHQAAEKLSQDEVLLGASNDVTAALRRTHALLTGELERSQFARDTLENSTRELSQLTERYSTLDTLLTSSRSLVSTLIHSRKSDTWYLETTVYILAATIAWLVFRRILYGPGWWLLYLPLRLVWWTLYTILIGPVLSIFEGGNTQSGALSASLSGSEAISSSTIVLANRRDMPTIPSDMPAPSVRVGAGGHGAKADDPAPLSGGDSGGGMADAIGQMAEKSRAETQQGEESGFGSSEKGEGKDKDTAGYGGGEEGGDQETVLRERTAADGPPNPKKRMYEEPHGDVSGGNRPRGEL